MKRIVFDSGPIISLSMNGLLPILLPLKRQFGGEFILPWEVKRELVDTPLRIKRYELESLQVLQEIKAGTLNLAKEHQFAADTDELMGIADSLFSAKDTPLHIVHRAEMEALAAAINLDADALVVDERTTRLLVEDPMDAHNLLETKLHTSIEVDKKALASFSKKVSAVKVIRSLELCLMAQRMGLFDDYIGKGISKQKVLDAIVWALRLKGCSISEEDMGAVLGGDI